MNQLVVVAAAIGVTLVYASVLDLRSRRVPFRTWYPMVAIGAPFTLWFYAVRFWPLNPTRSLLPCVAAHAAKNLGVLAVKAAQGHVSGWW